MSTTDADYRLGLELLKRFKDYIEKLSQASEEEIKDLALAIREPIRNATYRIRQGTGPLKEELLGALSVMVREFREMADLQALREASKKVLELLKKVEEKEGG